MHNDKGWQTNQKHIHIAKKSGGILCAAARTEQISFWRLENSSCNPHSPQPHCNKAFSISQCDNVEALVMIWSRKGDPKVSTGKPMYHSPAAIFAPIHEPSGPSKNKLLHFTVQWRERGLCLKHKLCWWPKVLPVEGKPTHAHVYRHYKITYIRCPHLFFISQSG